MKDRKNFNPTILAEPTQAGKKVGYRHTGHLTLNSIEDLFKRANEVLWVFLTDINEFTA
jgi:hypothetical protein